MGLEPFTHGGIDLDACGNVYVGTDDSIRIYDEHLNQIGNILAPDTTYDLQIEGAKLFLSGYNYVAQLDLDIFYGSADGMSMAVGNASCDVCNGTATVDIPTPPCPEYEIESITWSPGGEIGETITGLCPGWYTVNILYANDAGYEYTLIDSVEVIDEGGELTVDTEVFSEQCSGSCNGSVTFTPTSGEGPYSYDLDGEINSTGEFTDLCVGTYPITITDANGCEYNSTITIESEATLGLAVSTQNDPTCYGLSDGSITVETLGGVGEVTYTWDPENPVGGGTFNTLPAGDYTVTAVSSLGCEETITITLGQPDEFHADLTSFDAICHGEASGITVVDTVYNAQGDPNNVSYNWTPNPFGEDGIGVDSAYSLTAGEYVLTLTDDNGCSFITNFVIGEPEPLEFVELGMHPALCRKASFQSGKGVVFAAAVGGISDYTYEWVNLATEETSTLSTWSGLNAGEYQITATDQNGCTLTEIVKLDSITPVAKFSVNSDQLDENCEGTEVVEAIFTNESYGYANDLDPDAEKVFYWNLDFPDADWIITEDLTVEPDTSYNGEDIYTVCLVVQNENDCVDTTCKDLVVHVQPEFVAPNIFTPGGGVNDIFTFEFRTLGISEFNCVIVNRWGKEIIQLTDVTQGWDGTDKGGKEVPEGVYFYTYQAISTNGTQFKGQGNVTLVRP